MTTVYLLPLLLLLLLLSRSFGDYALPVVVAALFLNPQLCVLGFSPSNVIYFNLFLYAPMLNNVRVPTGRHFVPPGPLPPHTLTD